MNKSDIKKIYYNGNEITSLYWGGNLIYQKSVVPVFNPKRFAGKFSDDSVESEWKCKLNDKDYILPVNPETKEFDFEYEGELTKLNNCFSNTRKPEIIYCFPDTSKVTDMSAMFMYCSKLTTLDLCNFDTSKVTDMSGMFMYCSKLTPLDLSNFDTSKVTDINGMFAFCNSLTTLDLSNFDTSKVTNMINLFTGDNKLNSLDLSNFDFSNVKYLDNMFSNCTSLNNINGDVYGIKLSLSLAHSPLTNSSAMVFINGLSQVEETKTITFKSTTYDSLSQEQIALATSKGWSVVRY